MARTPSKSIRELGYTPELLTTRQAAELLQLTQDHLRVLLRSGEIQGLRITGSWRIPRDAILPRLATPSAAGVAPSTRAGRLDTSKGSRTRQLSDSASGAHLSDSAVSRRTSESPPVGGLSDSQRVSLTQREAAERLAVSQKTIGRMLARGELTPHKTGQKSGATRVLRDEKLQSRIGATR